MLFVHKTGKPSPSPQEDADRPSGRDKLPEPYRSHLHDDEEQVADSPRIPIATKRFTCPYSLDDICCAVGTIELAL